MPKPKLFLFDANSFCYRAFFAIKANLSTSYGQPTGAVYGFLNILNKILKENNPDYLSICFDVNRDTFRKEIFVDYKGGRPDMPDELVSQINIIKEVISAYKFSIFEKEGFEADDIIATIATKAENDFDVFVVSADKDMLQLINGNIRVYNPYHSVPIIDREAVINRFGIEAGQIADMLSLTGDAIDNIPGVKGIGEKTAVDLIKKYGNIDNLLSHIDGVLPQRVRNMLEEQKDKLFLSKRLVALNTQVPLNLDFAKLKVTSPDYDSLYRIFRRLEFKILLKDLPVKGAQPNAPQADVKKLDALSGVKKIVEEIKKEKRLVFLPEFSEGRIPKIYFYQGDTSYCVEDRFYPEFNDIFSDGDIKKIGHNLKQAMVGLIKYGIKLSGLDFDLMLAAYILNPAQASYDLEDLASEYLDADDILRKEKGPMVSVILSLKEVLEQNLRERNQEKLFRDIEMPLTEVLSDMEMTGVKIDLDILASLSEELEKRISVLEGEIYKISEKKFNINSPKQLRLILFDKLKLPIVKKTKTGPSTDEEVLVKLAAMNSLPALILDYRQLLKLKSTYIDALPGLIDASDGRLHTTFNQTGTQTGRLSSSNPNLQNIPVKTEEGRRIRLAFIPSKADSYLFACDYSQIELRILAHLSGDANLIRAFKEDKDVHRYTASLIFGVAEEKVSEKMRDTAKRVNFGIIYGMSSFGLSKDLGISNEDAGRFIDEYFLRYPGVKKYIDETIAKAKKDGFVATLLGRRRYLKEINSPNNQLRGFAERQAINAPIQGSASDMVKLAMVNIHNELKKKLLKSKMMLQVHDELIFDVDKNELKELYTLAVRNMENVLSLSVPIKVEAAYGKSWYSMESLEL
ncbi:MAG: DNA polymerase I [Candidatus Omnitrophota bacterium]|nr:DNA polymerase I [Candidatus Omnitrophota bacterium]